MKKQLTITDINRVQTLCRNLYKLEKEGLTDAELRRMCYNIGTYCYRQFHGVGIPAEAHLPGVKHPRKIYDKNLQAFVDERQLVAC